MTSRISADMLGPRSHASLTIAIPTFDRPHELRRCVSLLKNQTNYNFHLLIIDNASPVAASEALHRLLQDFPALSVRIVRNPVNIGGDANVLRCFELCETDYIWVLGDDDVPLSDAVETVLDELRAYPDAVFLNFASDMVVRTGTAIRTRRTESRDLESFVAAIDSFPNLLFASTSIFCRRELVSYLCYGFHRTYTMAPHLILLLQRLMTGPCECILSCSQIVEWGAPKEGDRWSFMRQAMGIGTLLDLPFSRDTRSAIAKHLMRPRALEFATIQLAAYRLRSGDTHGSRYLIDQVYGRLVRYAGGWDLRLRYLLCRRLLLAFPRITLAVFRTAVKVTHRGDQMLEFRDPFS